MKQVTVVKIGGNIIDDEVKLISFLRDFTEVAGAKILIHGGGKLATSLATSLGLPQRMIEGRRITDAETLKIVTMVYAGYINKNIVAKLQSLNCNALGLCGADGNLILSRKRGSNQQQGIFSADYGFVGDVVLVDHELLSSLFENDLTLVLAPITHNRLGDLLNTNADTIAQEVASALTVAYKVTLVYCFEKNGVLQNTEDESSVIQHLNKNNFKILKDNKTIHKGMIPKLNNAFKAAACGVSCVRIGNAANLRALLRNDSGTTITDG